jgi:hypothetical protein
MISGLKALGPHRFTIVDYSGGNDQDAYSYANTLWNTFISAGWTPLHDQIGSFLPVGGPPPTEVFFLFNSDTVPPDASEVSDILTRNGVKFGGGYVKFPMFAEHDDVIGIGVGRAAQ